MILCCSLICIAGITSLGGLLQYIDIVGLRIAAQVWIYLLIGAISFVSMKLTGMKITVDFRNKRHFLIGIAIATVLSAVIAVIPAVCGFSLVGNHQNFSWVTVIYDFLFYMLIVGPIEQYVFRVYLQDTFVGFFTKQKWIGVVIAAFLFGLWHIINGNIVQVLFTFGIGLVFGFAKYKIKDCEYISLAIGHGLYDFLNTLVRMFIV